jgi:hypothetical protein
MRITSAAASGGKNVVKKPMSNTKDQSSKEFQIEYAKDQKIPNLDFGIPLTFIHLRFITLCKI